MTKSFLAGGRSCASLALLVCLPWRGDAQEPYRLTLGDAARLAAERGPSVEEARSRLTGAEARVRQRTAALLPDLSADLVRGNRTFNTASFGLDFPTVPGQEPFFDPQGEVVGPVRTADVRLRAEVPILDLPALGRRRSANAEANAAHGDVSAAQERAAASAAMRYLEVLRARAELEAREEDLGLAEELRDVARGQLEAGVAVALDVTRAEAQVATVRAQLVAARHRGETAELALRRVLRLSETDALELADDLEGVVPRGAPVPPDAVEEALSLRQDLHALETYRAAAEEVVSADRAGRLPRLIASLDDGYYGRRFGHMLNTYAWTFRLSVPVFDGFQRSAEIEEDKARVRELELREEDLREQIRFEVRRALLNRDGAREQLEAVEERFRLASLEVAQEEERVRAGVAGTGDVVRAALRLVDARTARVDALTALKTSEVALAAALGTVTELP
jgi:outer membrane protein